MVLDQVTMGAGVSQPAVARSEEAVDLTAGDDLEVDPSLAGHLRHPVLGWAAGPPLVMLSVLVPLVGRTNDSSEIRRSPLPGLVDTP